MRLLQSVLACAVMLVPATASRAETFVRWTQAAVPSPASLEITTIVIPVGNAAAIASAVAQGYRVLAEIDGPAFGAIAVLPKGTAGVIFTARSTPQQVERVRRRLPGVRVQAVATAGKWPHIRSNWVTRNNETLQVSARSAQPWIENNAALIRLTRSAAPSATPMLTYEWTPITLADVDEGPALHDYLVAIAEADSYGADLLLPVHETLQKRLLLGLPEARSDWARVRRAIAFSSWSATSRYRPIANVALVAAEPMRWFEAANLLLRHNLPFDVVPPSTLPGRDLSSFDLAVVFDPLSGKAAEAMKAFAGRGGRVVDRTAPVTDPNAFALEVRQLLGPEHRRLDIWNGITVLAAAYADPDGMNMLVTVLNYADQPVPVQLRLDGEFSSVRYESPDEPASLLPYQHRQGHTEFVIPQLRAGGRVFLAGRK